MDSLSENSNSGGFKCEQCNKVFTHQSSLSRHQSSVHTESYFKCSGCGRDFDRKDSLVRHLKKGCKGAEKPLFTCTICKSSKSFRDKWGLERHMKKCTKCLKCKKSFIKEEDHICEILKIKLNRPKKPSKPPASTPSSSTSHKDCYDIPTTLAEEINWAMLFNLKPDSMQIVPGENTLINSNDFRDMLEDLDVDVDFDISAPIKRPALSITRVLVDDPESPFPALTDLVASPVPSDECSALSSTRVLVDDPESPFPALTNLVASPVPSDERPALSSTRVLVDDPESPFPASTDLVASPVPSDEVSTASANVLCQRRRRAAQTVADVVHSECVDKQVDPEGVMKLALKYLGLTKKFPHVLVYVARTPLETRLCVWNYWHEVSEQSTITTSLARLRQSERHGCQSGLEFMSTVQVVSKRRRYFYTSIWMSYTSPVLELYSKYLEENPDHRVSMGMFLNLRPFYVRNVTLKDMEMCVCKLHLHVRWCINAMIKLAYKLEITLPFKNYEGFFQLLYMHCDAQEHTYISWDCTPNKKTICESVTTVFNNVLTQLETAKESVTVKFTHFTKEIQHDEKGNILLNKKEKPIKRLVPRKVDATGNFLVQFLRNLLKNFVHHRNMLKLYRSLKHTFLDTMKAVYVDTDFSENLTIGIKWEPQSLHWCKLQVTVHSALVKYHQEKVYHPYVSDSRVHDQAFVRLSFEEIMDHTDAPDNTTIVWESDNCSNQAKSCEHFHDCQQLANQLNRTIIRLWGIAGHGKGEVDHVGGVAKVSARRAISGGTVFENSKEIVEFLNGKFGENCSPRYHIVEIQESLLQEERVSRRKKTWKTIAGSSDFHVAIFTPHAAQFKASPRLCMCPQCMVSYGSCNLFEAYNIEVVTSKTPALRNDMPPSPEIVGQEKVNEFVLGLKLGVVAR